MAAQNTQPQGAQRGTKRKRSSAKPKPVIKQDTPAEAIAKKLVSLNHAFTAPPRQDCGKRGSMTQGSLTAPRVE